MMKNRKVWIGLAALALLAALWVGARTLSARKATAAATATAATPATARATISAGQALELTRGDYTVVGLEIGRAHD